MKNIYVEITNVCNLDCSFCPPTARAPEFISADRFRLLLSRIRGKAENLYFHLKGEPLLHPDLGELVDLAGDAGFDVMITTNGSLLSARLPELTGRPALRRLNVSLHSLEDAGSDRAAAALDDVLKAVSALRGSDPERQNLSVISLRLWNRTDQEQTDLLLAGIERHFGLTAGSLEAALAKQEGKGVVVSSGISVHPAERFSWPSLRGTEHAGESEDLGFCRGFCRALRDQAGILADGTVVPCCLDGEGDMALGNVYETAWDDIVNSPRARALRDGFSERRVVEPLCRTCGYRTRF